MLLAMIMLPDHLPDQFIIAEITEYYTCQDK